MEDHELSLLDALQDATSSYVDMAVLLGAEQRLPSRLVAV